MGPLRAGRSLRDLCPLSRIARPLWPSRWSGSKNHSYAVGLGFPCREAMHLGTGQKEAANPIDIARRRLELPRLSIDGLDRPQPAIGVDMPKYSLPRPLNDRKIRLPVENLLVDPIGNRVSKERRARHLGIVIRIGIKQPRAPQAVRALNLRNLGRHFAELLNVLGPRGVV